MSRLVRTALQERARKFNIILDDVSLTHVKFSPDFTIAVEAKQIGTPSSFFELLSNTEWQG